MTIILVMSIICCCKIASAHKRARPPHSRSISLNQLNGNTPVVVDPQAGSTSYTLIDGTANTGNCNTLVFSGPVHRIPILPSYFLLWNTFDIGEFVCGDASVIKLQIPPGAVAEGVTGHIDIGVAFNGPFQYPPGLVPVSPVFWICVRGQENFQFQQPVTVTVRHCLHIDFCTRAPSSGLTFVVAKHSSNSYERLQAESRGTFTSGCTGMISTKHLSCLCICCDNAFDRTEYSLIQVPAESPCHATVDLHSATDISYYITYNLPYCIEAVKYYVKGRSVRNTKFHFQSQSEEHAFIQVQHPEEICGCLISSRALRDSHNYPDKKVSGLLAIQSCQVHVKWSTLSVALCVYMHMKAIV